MSRIRAHARHSNGYNYSIIKRYLCFLSISCLLSTIFFSIVFYFNINRVYILYSNTNLPNTVQTSPIKQTTVDDSAKRNDKIIREPSTYDTKIKYHDFNYLVPLTLSYENRTYANNIPILFRMPKRRNVIGLLLIFHGCGRSASDWFNTFERQRIIGAAIDLGYGCLAFQATDEGTSCWLSDSNINENPDVLMVLKGLKHFYKEFPKLESLPRFTFGASSGGMFSSVFVTNSLYTIQGQILFISIIVPEILGTHVKKNSYPPTAWIYMPRDVEFASENRIKTSMQTFAQEKIPHIAFTINPITLNKHTFHRRIPTIIPDASHYIFFRFQQNQWLDDKNHLLYNPRRTDTWRTFLFTANQTTDSVVKIMENINKNENIFPDFLNTIYGEHEISFERSYEALKWHLCIYNNESDC